MILTFGMFLCVITIISSHFGGMCIHLFIVSNQIITYGIQKILSVAECNALNESLSIVVWVIRSWLSLGLNKPSSCLTRCHIQSTCWQHLMQLIKQIARCLSWCTGGVSVSLDLSKIDPLTCGHSDHWGKTLSVTDQESKKMGIDWDWSVDVLKERILIELYCFRKFLFKTSAISFDNGGIKRSLSRRSSFVALETLSLTLL